MKRQLLFTIILTLAVIAFSSGQISPGDLSSSHEDLEGMSKCTLCHDIGEKVSNTKCLDCHKEIQSLLFQNKGYHAKPTIKTKECYECHSDHHGRKFDMVRFDEVNFDHDLSGYALEGEHRKIECRDCHISKNIADVELKKRKNTYLGLDQECLSCHNDFHQKTLSSDCLSCHNMEGFYPATEFDHNDADYPLLGEHINVECIECHKMTMRNGKEFQNFTDILFSDCKSCHSDPHNKQIWGKCSQCHTETSFSNFIGRGSFNHNITDFELRDQHKRIDCFSCHTRTNEPNSIFQDNLNISENSCVECHIDTHEGRYGNDCAKCHNETSFLALNNMDFFDHSVTDYPLEGLHLEVDCKECHIERYSEAIDFSSCYNCHTDYHNGEFIENNISPDCIECHTLVKGFGYSIYGIDQHSLSSFPLGGAHIATPCYACHIGEEDDRWVFTNLGSECVDCHNDIHENFISEKFYPDDSCSSCHINDAWEIVTFDHDLTEWSLEGEHKKVNCRECHIEKTENGAILTQKFLNLDTHCYACHENVHDELFEIDGITDCNRCHISDNWYPEKFDHNSTRFSLEGRHSEISCKDCHEIVDDTGSVTILYKLNKIECIDCHQ